MTYVLEKITFDDQQRILAIADERQRTRLKAYGFFKDRPNLVWAINKRFGYFLMNAPRQGEALNTPCFFFYFNRKLFNLSVASNFATPGAPYKPIRLSENPPAAELAAFQAELTNAFAVHCLSGLPNMEPPFIPTFESEGN